MTKRPIPERKPRRDKGVQAILDRVRPFITSPSQTIAEALAAADATERDATRPQRGAPAPEVHIVGGQVVATEITEAGVTQRIVKTWPDKIGEAIRPTPAPAVPIEGMSRQQHRAAEREARKRAVARGHFRSVADARSRNAARVACAARAAATTISASASQGNRAHQRRSTRG